MARANGPPPGRSIYDATPATQSSVGIIADTLVVPESQDVEAVSRAAKEISSTARTDHQRIDLIDLLSQTSRESSYSEVPAGVCTSWLCSYKRPASFQPILAPWLYIQCLVTRIDSCSGLPSLLKRLLSLGPCQTWYWTVSGRCRQPASVVCFLRLSLPGLQLIMCCLSGTPAGKTTM